MPIKVSIAEDDEMSKRAAEMVAEGSFYKIVPRGLELKEPVEQNFEPLTF